MDSAHPKLHDAATLTGCDMSEVHGENNGMLYDHLTSFNLDITKEDSTKDSIFSESIWDKIYMLFCFVCNPYRKCGECLNLIEDLTTHIRKSTINSPASALLLDVVVQRAMYELSDKMCREVDLAGDERSCSVRNIESCIAISLQVVTPVITRLAEQLKMGGSPIGLNERTATLTRQLQELIAWSSFHGQVTVPDSFPKYPARLSDDCTPPLSSRGSEGHSYPLPHDPSASAYSNPTVRILDDAICHLLRDVSAKLAMPQGLLDSVQMNLFKVLNCMPQQQLSARQNYQQAVQKEIGVHFCGSAALGLSDVETKQELDFISLVPPYHANFHNLSTDAKRAQIRVLQELQRESMSLEREVEAEVLAENALKHLKACIKDFRASVSDFLNKLSNSSSPRDVGKSVAHHQSPRYNNYPHGRPSGPSEELGQLADGVQHSPMSPRDVAALQNATRIDVEALSRLSDALVDRLLAAQKSASAIGSLMSTKLKRLETIHEQLDRAEADRFNALRKVAKTMEKQLMDVGYAYVRAVSHKTRFLHVKFVHQEYGLPDGVLCNLIVHNVLPMQATDMLSAYMNIDKSGKVRDFLHIVKLFVKSHRIADPANGYLSSFAWSVMAIHVLLRHGFLPNIHDDVIYRADTDPAVQSPRRLEDSSATPLSSRYVPSSASYVSVGSARGAQEMSVVCTDPAMPKEVTFCSARQMYLPARYVAKLENTSIMELLDTFFRYFVERFDLFDSVVSLKGQGEVLRKQRCWSRTQPVLWRLSIEDPFDHSAALHPVDLGATLSRPGQLTTFKALRRAIYGIHSIVAVGIDACGANIKKLFSRTDLIHLARKSDYLGAVITASPLWTRSTLCSDDYKQRLLALSSATATCAPLNEGDMRRDCAERQRETINHSLGESSSLDQVPVTPLHHSHAVQPKSQRVASSYVHNMPRLDFHSFHQQGSEQLDQQRGWKQQQHSAPNTARSVSSVDSLYSTGPAHCSLSARLDYMASPRQYQHPAPRLHMMEYHQEQLTNTPRDVLQQQYNSAPNSARYSHVSGNSSSPLTTARTGAEEGLCRLDRDHARKVEGHDFFHPRSHQVSAHSAQSSGHPSWTDTQLTRTHSGFSLSEQQPNELTTHQPQKLRSDAAEFRPQFLTNTIGSSHPQLSQGTEPNKVKRQQPMVPLIQLSQLKQASNHGDNYNYMGDEHYSSSSARLREDLHSDSRYLDLSGHAFQSAPTTARTADNASFAVSQLSTRSVYPASLHSGTGSESSRDGGMKPNAEFQLIMDKMTSDALSISHSMVSARSSSSAGNSTLIASARSTAHSGTTTADRFSLGSGTLSTNNTPRGTGDFGAYLHHQPHVDGELARGATGGDSIRGLPLSARGQQSQHQQPHQQPQHQQQPYQQQQHVVFSKSPLSSQFSSPNSDHTYPPQQLNYHQYHVQNQQQLQHHSPPYHSPRSRLYNNDATR